jgi:pimeloyl-ACP methyl ester carboxylesterase
MSVAAEDLWIAGGAMRLYARRWTPAGAAARTPIVLFHDSLGCVALWRDFPERLALATGHPVIAYDRLGFGQSSAYPGALPSSFIGDEARSGFQALRRELGIGRFIAFGHSVGGCMAVCAAAANPADCAALLTVSAQSFVEDRTREGIIAAREMFAQDGQMERLVKYHGDKARWVLDAWTETWLSDEFAYWTLDAALQQVRCPALAMHGDRDEYGSIVHPQRIAGLIGGSATAKIFDECGHVPHREIPERLLEFASTWLHEQHGAA